MSTARSIAAIIASLTVFTEAGASGPACPAPPVDPAAVARTGGTPWEPALEGRAIPGTSGNVHLLVILAEFADRPHRIDPSRFEQLLFGEQGATLRDYYLEVSGGRLEVTGEVVGWVPLPESQFYYSQGNGGIGGYPTNGQRMTEDAVLAAVGGGGLDLRDYDADADAVVDALLVIHSGQGREWSASNLTTERDDLAINSHKWVVRQSTLQPGAPRVEDYFTCPELQLVKPIVSPTWTDSIATLGVFAHEFGHVLGLPDFYDTGDPGINHVGVWDLMDYGTWTRVDNSEPPGATPAHFSAWSKTFLGWVEPLALDPPIGETAEASISLASATLGGSPLQALPNPFGVDWTPSRPGTGEYFLAEYRTRDGYDAGLPGEGILVYHVDESRRDNSALTNPGDGRLLQLEPRDGETSVSPLADVVTELWPGAGENSFDASSRPSSDFHDGSPSGVGFSGMTAGGGSAAFLASVANLRSEVGAPFARPNPWHPSTHGPVRLVVSLDAAGTTGSLHVYDVTGRRVRTLTASGFDPGGRVATWDGLAEDGRPVAAGLYFLHLEGASGATGKVVLVRR